MRYSLDAYAPIIQEDKSCSIPIPMPLLNFIFFIIVKSYSCYLILLYLVILLIAHSLLPLVGCVLARYFKGEVGKYTLLYLRCFAILAWSLPCLSLEKADEVLRIFKAEVLADLRDG